MIEIIDFIYGHIWIVNVVSAIALAIMAIILALDARESALDAKTLASNAIELERLAVSLASRAKLIDSLELRLFDNEDLLSHHVFTT